IARGIALPFSRPFTRVFVREARTLREFDVRWQPAVLGRRDLRDPSKNRLLAVDLEGMEPLPSVSRHHAAITEETGSIYIEAITERNPVLLNGQRVPPGARRVLSAGDTIKLGDFVLNFYVVA
ncbi:MAG: FHA domain-containing protein, partial [Thermoflexales bacterium]